MNIWTEFNWLQTEARFGILQKDQTYEGSIKKKLESRSSAADIFSKNIHFLFMVPYMAAVY